VDAARIETCRSDLAHVVLAVSGEIDLAIHARLVSSVRAAADLPGVERIVVDLTRSSFLDASGISALLIGRRAAHSVGVAYQVVGMAGQVRQLLEMTQMIGVLTDSSRPDSGEVARPGLQERSMNRVYRPTRPSPLRSHP
jgi:anti-sigma B factor antagonist